MTITLLTVLVPVLSPHRPAARAGGAGAGATAPISAAANAAAISRAAVRWRWGRMDARRCRIEVLTIRLDRGRTVRLGWLSWGVIRTAVPRFRAFRLVTVGEAMCDNRPNQL